MWSGATRLWEIEAVRHVSVAYTLLHRFLHMLNTDNILFGLTQGFLRIVLVSFCLIAVLYAVRWAAWKRCP